MAQRGAIPARRQSPEPGQSAELHSRAARRRMDYDAPMRVRRLKRHGRVYRIQAEFIADAWHIRVFRDGHLVQDFQGPTEDEAERSVGLIEAGMDEAQRFVESGALEPDARSLSAAEDDSEPDEPTRQ